MTQLRGMLIGFVALLVSACGSSTPAAHGGDMTAAGSGADPASAETSLAAASGVVAGITDADLPACTRDPALVPDASPPACRSSRTYLSCDLGLGAVETCPSDDPQQCPGGGPADHCKLLCQPNEYAVLCGTIGPSIPPTPEPPAGCRFLPAEPGGGTVSCCPCL